MAVGCLLIIVYGAVLLLLSLSNPGVIVIVIVSGILLFKSAYCRKGIQPGHQAGFAISQ
jgi:hypothetical protein